MPDYDKNGYYKTKRVVGYVSYKTKVIMLQEKRLTTQSVSDIVCKAMNEYYERRPELVANIKNRMGKNSW